MTKRKIYLSIVMLFLMVGLYGCGKPKVNLNNYVKIVVDGYNTYGSARMNFDSEAFAMEIGRAHV